jgi:hypothetical protein
MLGRWLRWDYGGLTTNFFLVAFQDAVFLHCANVEYADGLVPRGRGDHAAVRGPGKGLNGVFVLMPVANQT